MSELKTISDSQELVSQELNNQVLAVLSNKVEGFQKAFVMASAIQVLKDRLTPEFMKPIMALQGSNLGFKTDKDKNQGYPEIEVKACLIDAVLLGLQPTGNEFNIIAGNMYPTRQGFGSLLKKISGLKYSIAYSNPIFTQDKSSATCTTTIKWELNGEQQQQDVEFAIKSNAYASADAIIGKAERKARRWLFNTVEGTDVPDGDVSDITHEVVKTTINPDKIANEKELARVQKHIEGSKSVDELERCKVKLPLANADMVYDYVSKHIKLSTSTDELGKILELVPEDDHDLTVEYHDKLTELKKSK